MNDPVDISVIIPVYNTNSVMFKRLISCFSVEEIITIEIIIVDDGSNEET